MSETLIMPRSYLSNMRKASIRLKSGFNARVFLLVSISRKNLISSWNAATISCSSEEVRLDVAREALKLELRDSSRVLDSCARGFSGLALLSGDDLLFSGLNSVV